MLKRIGILLAATVVFVVGSQSMAAAAWEGMQRAHVVSEVTPHATYCASSADTHNKACYKPNGDFFYVFDWSEDGQRMGVQWQTSYGRSGMCYYIRVNGIMGPKTGGCNKNFKEHTKITFRVGVCDGDAYGCGRPVTGSGWHGFGAWKSHTT